MSREDADTAVAIEAIPPEGPAAVPDQLMVLHDPAAQRTWKLIALAGGVVRVGRNERNNIVFADEDVSSEHARLERVGANWALQDVGSTNGTFVNDVRLHRTVILKPQDRVRFGSVLVKFLSGADVETQRITEIAQAALHDALTGLHNRRPFDDSLPPEVRRAKRYRRPLSLILIDIDHFKKVNDRYGHPSGDSVLCAIARLLKSRVREYDHLARYGGEEFAILLPETDLRGARALAEDLCQAVATIAIPDEGRDIRVTISCGVAELSDADAGAAELVGRCDAALYEAKDGGRNRVAG